ncbi:MAG: nucleoside transporter C-terminal domain-containing protein [Bacteroidota bacterium]|nr:NupC/NupG family nucleoside CNT transporter [Candidatus Kapabacteria bacterium]MDW8221080.1 nucleoside transporter C-terminal domain-containing protein [Bacteroidota bacterium]
MERLTGILGIVCILALAYLLSNNRRAINIRIVLTGLGLQSLLAIFILKVPLGQQLFSALGNAVSRLLDYSNKGAEFVFGILVRSDVLERVFGAGSSFVFALKVAPTIIFVSVLVSIAYHIGLMQRIIAVIAKGVYYLMGVSGSEALSNVASAFVGQVEAQIMIKPYVAGMTNSELLASMSGSMACIAGGVMAVYISMGVPAPYLIAASLMAAPAALVVAKIVYPETEESETKGEVRLEIKKQHVNLIDAIAHGASDGMKISINVIAMLIGFIALIAMVDAVLGFIGGVCAEQFGWSLSPLGVDLAHLSLKDILGMLFSGFAFVMGVPLQEIQRIGALLGTKFVINEFVAYTDMSSMIAAKTISPKALVIASFALCGFANLSSIAIQVGGIGELAPSRRSDLAKLGVRALICGTLASYLSATIAGILVG